MYHDWQAKAFQSCLLFPSGDTLVLIITFNIRDDFNVIEKFMQVMPFGCHSIRTILANYIECAPGNFPPFRFSQRLKTIRTVEIALLRLQTYHCSLVCLLVAISVSMVNTNTRGVGKCAECNGSTRHTGHVGPIWNSHRISDEHFQNILMKHAVILVNN